MQIALNWAVPTVLAGVFGLVAKLYKKNKQLIEQISADNQNLKASIRSLLSSQIVGKCEQWLEVGYLPSHVRSCLSELYKEYKNLGGNHGVDSLVEQCLELPPKKGE